jgi:hypothetical protein
MSVHSIQLQCPLLICDHDVQETFDSAVEENIAEFDMEVR